MTRADPQVGPDWDAKGTVKTMAKWFIILGALLLLIGAALQFAPWLLSWFGKLPGDIRIRTDSTSVFIPITSMILVSLALTLLLNLLNR